MVVNGVDVAAAAKEKGRRIHYCPYCKKTLNKTLQENANKTLKKVMEPDADLSGDEEASREGDRGPSTKPPVDSLIQVAIETGRGTKKYTETF